jgi:uncharacterized protein (TIGR03083 family)
VDVERYIEILESEGRLLIEATRSTGLEVPVPSCPRWRLGDLLAHVGYVHRWAATYVAEGRTEMVEGLDEAAVLGAAPAADGRRDWVVEGHAALVRALSDARPDLRCWTFLEAPSPLAMWARRQAHETAVHRADAQLAAGESVTEVDPAFAVDGIDELVFGFLGRRRSAPAPGESLGTLGLCPTDRPERFTVRIGPGTIEADRELTVCDVVLEAPASDLYLLLWNRPAPAVDTDGAGGRDLVAHWRRRFEVTWS